MNQRSSGCSQRLLTQDAHNQLTILHNDLEGQEIHDMAGQASEMTTRTKDGTHLGVPRRNVLVGSAVLLVWVGTVRSDTVNVPGDDQREDLLSSPERTWFQDGRLRNLAIPCRKKHEQIHDFPLKEILKDNQRPDYRRGCKATKL